MRILLFVFFILLSIANAEVIPNTSSAQVSSTVNSTDEQISALGSYTGTWETTTRPDAQIWVKASGAATLFIEFSPDGGTTVDQFPFGGITLAAGIPHYDHVVVGGQSFRLRVVDTSNAANDIITMVTYGDYQRPSSVISTGISATSGSIKTKAVIFGKDSDDTYREVYTNTGNALVVANFDTEVALSNISGYMNNAKFGRVKALDAADNSVDIWAFADDNLVTRTDTKTFPTSADTLYVTSSSVSDTDVDVTLEYIASDGSSATVSVNTDGQTPVSTGVTGLDVNRLRVTGATGAVGTLYASQGNAFTAGVPTDTSKVLAVAPAGYNQSQLSHFTVPLGKTLIIKSALITMSRGNGSAGSADVTLRVKDYNKASRVIREFFPTSSVPIQTPDTFIVIEERAQVVWRVDDVSDSDTQVSCVWIYELIDD